MMRQALHIFAKDVRRLRYEIVVVLAILATFAWVDGRATPWLQGSALQGAYNILRPLLILAWWFLIARALYEEPLVGHTQFWVTRPFGWKSLLGAKLLFVAVFVNLPLFLSDCAIVTMHGFPPLAYPAALAWHQLMVCVWLLLPVAALACVTEGVSQLALALFAILLVGLVASSISSLLAAGTAAGNTGPKWLLGSLIGVALLVGTLGTVFLQYRSRRTWVGRGVLAGAFGIILALPPLVPFGSTFAVEARLLKPQLDAAGITLAVNSDISLPKARQALNPGYIRVELPVDLAGLPAGILPVAYSTAARLYFPDSRRPSSPYRVDMAVTDPPTFAMDLPTAIFAKLRTGFVRIHLVGYFGLFGNARSERMRIEPGPHRALGIGICNLTTDDLNAVEDGSVSDRWLNWGCDTPFRTPPLVTARFEGTKGWGHPLSNLDDSPYPASFGASPFGISPMVQMMVNLWYKPGTSAVVLTKMQPLARIRREIDIPGSRFANMRITGVPGSPQ